MGESPAVGVEAEDEAEAGGEGVVTASGLGGVSAEEKDLTTRASAELSAQFSLFCALPAFNAAEEAEAAVVLEAEVAEEAGAVVLGVEAALSSAD